MVVFPRVAISQTCPHNAWYTRGLTKTIVGPSGLGSSACGQPSLGRTNFSQAGLILDAKNGPAELNLVNQIWSGRTSFGIQNRSGRTEFTRTDISVTVVVTKNLVRGKNQSSRTIFSRPNLVRPDHF